MDVLFFMVLLYFMADTQVPFIKYNNICKCKQKYTPVQQLIELELATNKPIKLLLIDHLWVEFTGDQWIPLTKGQ